MNNGDQNIRLKIVLPLFLVCISYTLSAQRSNSTTAKTSTFGGAVTVQNKGISTIPNLTLGKPAVIFDMRVGRKLTFEPQFRFSLKESHGPWFSGGDIIHQSAAGSE